MWFGFGSSEFNCDNEISLVDACIWNGWPTSGWVHFLWVVNHVINIRWYVHPIWGCSIFHIVFRARMNNLFIIAANILFVHEYSCRFPPFQVPYYQHTHTCWLLLIVKRIIDIVPCSKHNDYNLLIEACTSSPHLPFGRMKMLLPMYSPRIVNYT